MTNDDQFPNPPLSQLSAPVFRGVHKFEKDEIASMCAIIRASLTGKKVMTAPSGPGPIAVTEKQTRLMFF